VEVNTRILFQELPHQGHLVSREIVEDDVDLLPGCAKRDDFLVSLRDFSGEIIYVSIA
jgi:hypothetical protein